ncbi:MAG TPA: hypothetical protein VK642_13165 [Burkholderiales bacterium]|nr:hypothetical protein [Burkholderiales bacterium]
MPGLFEQVVREPYKIVPILDVVRGKVNRWELDRPVRYTARLKNMGVDRVEVVVKQTDVQRIMDAADPEVKRYRKRGSGDAADPDNVFRAALRAKAAVRSWCIRGGVDRMLTFGTRVTISAEEFLLRWMRFCKRYEYHTKKKFTRLAVFEFHADGEHLHAHVATVGFFNLAVALPIWHTLCAADDDSQEVNGSINAPPPWQPYKEFDDVRTIIAGYMTKYITKSIATRFNKKSFLASRIGTAEVGHILLESDNLTEAVAEVRDRLGFDLSQVIMLRTGCFYVFPDDTGVWLNLRPDMRRDEPPF